ncbi:dihydroorotase family protein [Micromonospora sp. WMMD1102]|uniref:dihydroorotase n=1 Tax=Micromonospora sp. WMMD1102 TaxID=3016105 RepID=UPI0024157404|nr:dihydroorotase family protein [Micromonospora sp. WMMD1102]MDG4788060.1 dihydroorotase family protein [Micromonospora sp. WMMD1102]
MSADVLFAGGTAVLPVGPVLADVAVRDGVITAVGEPGTLAADHVVDVRGLVVLPGAIDVHVHFRQPGFEYKEDFASGTAAAACGGVTTVCDMPNTHPPVTTASRFRAKQALAANAAHVDFALWAGGTDLFELTEMAALGAVGVKVYMNRSHRPDDPYAAELSMPDDETLRKVFWLAADLGLPVAVHVADHEHEARVRARLQAVSTTDARLVCRSYRSDGVLDGLERVLAAARDIGTRVHVAHASLAPTSAIGMIAAARDAGGNVSCECGPPALLEDELDTLGVRGVPFAFPPDDADFYWSSLADGSIDLVATDHAPHSKADKDVGRNNVWDAPPGYPGVETSLPLMVDAVLSGRLTWRRLVELTSAAPARLCGLTTKGAIARGVDADLVLVDPSTSRVVAADRLHSKAGWTPFEGRQLSGALTATYLRGRLVAQDGQVVDGQHMGRFVSPPRWVSERGQSC